MLAGLEAYYYQPLESLRWRGYRALYEGCAGVRTVSLGNAQGQSRPPQLLAGPERRVTNGLEAVLLAPPGKSVRAQGAVQFFEEPGVRSTTCLPLAHPGAQGFPFTATFQGVRGSVKVRGEGRNLQADGTLRDVFAGPYSVHVYEYLGVSRLVGLGFRRRFGFVVVLRWRWGTGRGVILRAGAPSRNGHGFTGHGRIVPEWCCRWVGWKGWRWASGSEPRRWRARPAYGQQSSAYEEQVSDKSAASIV